MQINRHGLVRPPRAEFRRAVRRNSKQGCVICRGLFCDYHHCAPEFVDATHHDPDGICLLCLAHHGEVTRGRLLNQQVVAAYARIRANDSVRPPCHQTQITGTLKLGLGDSTFDHMPTNACVLRSGQEEVLSIRYTPDEVFGGVYPSISGTIRNANAEPVLIFEDNTIMLSSYELDAEVIGRRITVRDAKGMLCLKLSCCARQRERSSAAMVCGIIMLRRPALVFGSLEHKAGVCLLQRALNPDHAAVKVDVTPTQRDEFTAPHSGS